MKIEPFLTEIAKKYNSKIKFVAFYDLKNYMGIVSKLGNDSYRILLDRRTLPCPDQVLFVLYHEIAHVILGHCDLGKQGLIEEAEADGWAYKEKGVLDSDGFIKQGQELCFECMKMRSQTCLKGYDLISEQN